MFPKQEISCKNCEITEIRLHFIKNVVLFVYLLKYVSNQFKCILADICED